VKFISREIERGQQKNKCENGLFFCKNLSTIMIINIFIMNPFYLFLIILLLLVVISKAADYFVHSASRVAVRFGISELIIGLTIVALGTSAPEFTVSAIAAAKGEGALSLSNIVGSNIFVLGFTLGFIGLFSHAVVNRVMLYRDCSILLFSTFLLYIFLLDGVMARWEGGVFLGIFVLWFILLFKIREPKKENNEHEPPATWKDFVVLILSLITIVITGKLIVDTAVDFARLMGVSEWMIGVTVVAIGTSLPEFVTSVVAMMKKKIDMSVGGLIGSGVFNIVAIIGTSAVIRPIIPGDVAGNSILILLVTMVIMTIFLATGRVLNKWEAGILFGIAIARIVMDVLAC